MPRQVVNVSPSLKRAERRLSLAEALQAQNMQAKPSSLAETLLRLGGAYFQNRAIDKASADLDQAVQAQEEAKAKRLNEVLAMVMGGGQPAQNQPPLSPVTAPPQSFDESALYQMQVPTSAPMTPSPVPNLGGGAVGASGLPSFAPPSQMAATTPPAGSPPSPAGGAYPPGFAPMDPGVNFNTMPPPSGNMPLPQQQRPAMPNQMAQMAALYMADPGLAQAMAPMLAAQMKPDTYSISGGYRMNERTGDVMPLPQQAPPDPWRPTDGGLVNQVTGEFKPFPAGQGGGGPFTGKGVDAQSLNYLVQTGQLTPQQAAEIGAGKTLTGPNGEVMFATPGALIGNAMSGGQQPGLNTVRPGSMATTDKTAILDAQEQAQLMGQADAVLAKAQELDSMGRVMSGAGAGLQQAAGRLPVIGGAFADPQQMAATAEYENLVATQALSQLKAIFGGNPTEGERKVLLDLQASITKTPEERRAILQTARNMLAQRRAMMEQRAQAISSGQIYQPQMQPQPQPQQPAAPQAQRFRYDPTTDQMVPR